MIRNLCKGEDNLRTLVAFQKMGITIGEEKEGVVVEGKGGFLSEPSDIIDAGNSGTAARLLTGLLSGQEFFSVITGDDSLRKRPMRRVVDPLRMMGATILGRGDGNFAPLGIYGKRLRAISHSLPIPSAQVKSSLLLAGLYAEGVTKIEEPSLSRDHTERMLLSLGADLKREGKKVSICGFQELTAQEIQIPGDISSAAFLMVAALITPHSEILIRDVGINPTRSGIIEILTKMGAKIQIENQRDVGKEPMADIRVGSSQLKGTKIDGDMIPRIIDEIPVLAVAASLAEGETLVRGAGEVRFKETDRLRTMSTELSKMGVRIEEFQDGMLIRGGEGLRGNKVESYGDHRVAMSLLVAGLRAKGETEVLDTACIETSFPNFMETLKDLSHEG